MADCVHGQIQSRRSILSRHPREKTHFDETGQVRIAGFQGLQREVDIEDRLDFKRGGGSRERAGFRQGERASPATFFRATGAGVVYQNASHDAGGEGVKLGTTPDIRGNSSLQPQEGFMNKGRRLQRMGDTFAPHLAGGEAMELVVDQWSEAAEGLRGPLPQFDQVGRDGAGCRLAHGTHYAAA